MAELGTNASGQDTLFITPDHLMLHHELNSCFQDPRQNLPQSRAAGDHSSSAEQAKSISFADQQRPNLSLPVPSTSDWQIPAQASFRPSLPPTPIPTFRPLRTLTEEERLAFPCLGGPGDCWNPSLCPKHRQCPDTPSSGSSPGQSGSSSTTSSRQQQSRQSAPPNARRRSCPATDSSEDQEASRVKFKRHATELDHHHHHHRHPHQHSLSPELPVRPTIHRSRDSRSSTSSQSRGRVPHNLIERRYRDNLNHQIEALRLVLPTLKDAVPLPDPSDTSASSSSASPSYDHPRMPSKAIIISSAVTYVKNMEEERQRLLAANEALQEQVESLQKLVRGDDLGVVQYLNAMRLTQQTTSAAAASVGLGTPA